MCTRTYSFLTLQLAAFTNPCNFMTCLVNPATDLTLNTRTSDEIVCGEKFWNFISRFEKPSSRTFPSHSIIFPCRSFSTSAFVNTKSSKKLSLPISFFGRNVQFCDVQFETLILLHGENLLKSLFPKINDWSAIMARIAMKLCFDPVSFVFLIFCQQLHKKNTPFVV